jgi:hypothetical protein
LEISSKKDENGNSFLDEDVSLEDIIVVLLHDSIEDIEEDDIFDQI